MTELTERLQTIANEISDDESVCDVGTDHGYLPLYLYANNHKRKIVMADVSKGSLEKCRENCLLAYPDESFDLRLGSGLEVLSPGEVDTIVMAGMGGILMTELLGVEPQKHSFKKYILQPRRHVGRLRYWLLTNGFEIVNEKLVRESRFIWPILTVKVRLDDAAKYSADNYLLNCDSLYDSYEFTNINDESIEFEYPATLIDFKNVLTYEYLKNALSIEEDILSSKLSANNIDDSIILEQKHRVEYLSKLIYKI